MNQKLIFRIVLAICLVFLTYSTYPTIAFAKTSGAAACTDPNTCSKTYLPMLAKNTRLPAGQGIKTCLVTDTGGINDNSFNGLAWLGMQDAQALLGTSSAYRQSQQQSDFTTNINAFVQENCNLIVTVGFLLGDPTKTAAQANPTQKFAIVDYCYGPDPGCDNSAGPISNILGLTYDIKQPSFLAGYLAAATSQTGKVGTYGGLQIPQVTAFMDGFYYGVQYYNVQKSKSVQVLGWDPVLKAGLFSNTFSDQSVGITMGQNLMTDGADVILPVAGGTGLGTAIAVLAHGNAWVIGVDTDWTITNPVYQSITLTSVIKKIDAHVFNTINKVVNGGYAGGTYLGTLANNGVGLGTIASAVSDTLKAEIEQVKAGIIAGTIQVEP